MFIFLLDVKCANRSRNTFINTGSRIYRFYFLFRNSGCLRLFLSYSLCIQAILQKKIDRSYTQQTRDHVCEKRTLLFTIFPFFPHPPFLGSELTGSWTQNTPSKVSMDYIYRDITLILHPCKGRRAFQKNAYEQ